MKDLDDGPDGLNDAAFDRALGLGRKRSRARKARPAAAAHQLEMNAISLEDWQPNQPDERWCAVEVVERYWFDNSPRIKVRLLEGPESGRVVSGLSPSQIRERVTAAVRS